MSATHSTTPAASAKTSKRTSAKRGAAPVSAKVAPASGRPASKAPAKKAGKTPEPPKHVVKKPVAKQAKVAVKATKAPVKTGKAAVKAGKPAPKKAAVVASAGKSASKQQAKTPAAAVKVSAPKGKTAPQKAKQAHQPAKTAAPKGKAVSHKAVDSIKKAKDTTAHAKAGPTKAKAAVKAAPPKAPAHPEKPAPKSAKAAHETHKTVAAKPAPPKKPEVPAVKPGKPAAKEKSVNGVAETHPSKPETVELKRDRSQDEIAKKQPVRKSSLVDFPVPPPPVRPPFVPPKPAAAPTEEAAPAGINASHSPAFIQKQRQRLLDLRDDLVDALSGMTRDTIRNAPEGSEASGSGMHQGDAGSDAYDRDFALSVLAKEQDALYEIDQALRRIQKGIYGICEISNRKIPQARLEAIPFARLTVECQSQWEKEYGNRRFRPSNEVGFSGGNLIEEEDSETVLLDEEED